jgi:hypothetical protein
MDRFTRTGTWAALAGGLLLASGAAITAATSVSPFSRQVVTTSFALAASLRLLGTCLMIWGTVALYLRQGERAGRLGLVAVVACLFNLVLQTGWMFSDLFVAPVIAGSAPQILDGNNTSRLSVAFMLAWLFNASFVLLGVATWRAHVLPRTTAVGLLAAGLITFVPLPFDGPIYEVVIGVAFALAAAATLRRPVTATVAWVNAAA